MTERLTTLLHAEVTAVPVPDPPTLAILTSGRRLRRRRRTGQIVVGLALVTALSVGIGPLLFGGPGIAQQRYAAASPEAAYQTYGAFSTGRTVHIGNHEVTFDEKVKSLYYTSEGVLVRTGAEAFTDSPGPSHYVLVHPDGTTRTIDLRMGDRVPGTDPESPFVTYAEPNGDRWDLVAVDVTSGREAARTTVSGAFTWGGWEAPPVATTGSRMWALFDRGWVEYDWETGGTRTVPGTQGAPLDAAHGVFATHPVSGDTNWKVHDFATGRLLADIPIRASDVNALDVEYGWLSPDGRYVRLDLAGASRFVSVETVRSVSLPGKHSYGWTPDGHSLSVDPKDDTVTVCDPGTADCDTVEVPMGSGKVKLGGASYES